LLEQPHAQAEAQLAGLLTTTKGTVDTIADGELVITRSNAPALRLKIDPQVTVSQNGQSVALSELHQGAVVTVSYRVERDQPIVQMIEATGSPAPAGQP
jgi:hypothetical protein